MAFEGACAQVEKQCYTKKEFADIEIELYEKTINRGFMFGYLPFPSVMFCGALAEKSITIDPSGDVHKCWNFIGDHNNRVGELMNHGIQFNHTYARWKEYDPYTNSTCKECDIFPLCTGGCPYNILVLGQAPQNNCIPWKWNLDRVVNLAYESGGDMPSSEHHQDHKLS
ncbi:SPASM domain-containing protein [Paenibacillus polymyxa]|uniref:SPASM domain-containing protein n=1 Tax=Paenibacillus polymyxa TaxID=1406 RepID=UPI002ED3F8F0|nr:SPASM domain-containing protein [Paenibacillus polymyxa]